MRLRNEISKQNFTTSCPVVFYLIRDYFFDPMVASLLGVTGLGITGRGATGWLDVG
mgnify:CR=1 FL=1